MGVAGELEAETGLLHNRQAHGRVVEQDAGLGAFTSRSGRKLSSTAFMRSGEDES